MLNLERVRYLYRPNGQRITEYGVKTPKLSPNGRRPGSAPVPEVNILTTPETEGPTPVDLEKLELSGLSGELMRENPGEGTIGDINDNTKLYLREIGRYPLLTQPEECQVPILLRHYSVTNWAWFGS